MVQEKSIGLNVYDMVITICIIEDYYLHHFTTTTQEKPPVFTSRTDEACPDTTVASHCEDLCL